MASTRRPNPGAKSPRLTPIGPTALDALANLVGADYADSGYTVAELVVASGKTLFSVRARVNALVANGTLLIGQGRRPDSMGRLQHVNVYRQAEETTP